MHITSYLTAAFLTNALHPDGVPNDGVPIEDVMTVSVALTVVYAVFAAAGLAFAVVCIFFTLIFRNRKYVSINKHRCLVLAITIISFFVG